MVTDRTFSLLFFSCLIIFPIKIKQQKRKMEQHLERRDRIVTFHLAMKDYYYCVICLYMYYVWLCALYASWICFRVASAVRGQLDVLIYRTLGWMERKAILGGEALVLALSFLYLNCNRECLIVKSTQPLTHTHTHTHHVYSYIFLCHPALPKALVKIKRRSSVQS